MLDRIIDWAFDVLLSDVVMAIVMLFAVSLFVISLLILTGVLPDPHAM